MHTLVKMAGSPATASNVAMENKRKEELGRTDHEDQSIRDFLSAELRSNGESSPTPWLGGLHLAHPMAFLIALHPWLLRRSYFILFQVGVFSAFMLSLLHHWKLREAGRRQIFFFFNSQVTETWGSSFRCGEDGVSARDPEEWSGRIDWVGPKVSPSGRDEWKCQGRIK